jgi:hypothetical protein
VLIYLEVRANLAGRPVGPGRPEPEWPGPAA